MSIEMSIETQKFELFSEMLRMEDVSEEMKAMQQVLRIRKECVMPVPVEEEPPLSSLDIEIPVDIVTLHPDSHLTTVSCVPIQYRIPALSVQGIDDTIVFGVMSEGEGSKIRRDSIRNTWGQDSKVFFVVAELWDDISDEYNEHNDILWVDNLDASLKAETFLIAMHDQVMQQNPEIVEYFFKTEDDCYIDVPYLKQQIELMTVTNEKKVDYWGLCIENEKPNRGEWDPKFVPFKIYPYNYFPSSCIGHGYVLSSQFLACTVGDGHVEKALQMQHEEHAVGLLAEKCNIQPLLSPFEIDMNIREDMTKKLIVQRNVTTLEEMIMCHSKIV